MIYQRNCNNCNKFYIGRNKYFCSGKCRTLSAGNLRKYFFDRTIIGQNNECWTWVGTILNTSYGQVYHWRQRDSSHRLSWKIHFGPIPKGLCVCHSCDNPPCVNPDHLFLGTKQDNMRDMTEKGRVASYKNSNHRFILHPESIMKGERHYNAKLTEKQVLEIRKLYATKKYTQEELSRKYEVNRSTIGYIVIRKNWKHI